MTTFGSDPSLSLELQQRIHRICTEFEAVLSASGKAEISDYLTITDEPARSALLTELLHLDLECASDQSVAVEEFYEKFPDHRDVIDQVFAERRGIRKTEGNQSTTSEDYQAVQHSRGEVSQSGFESPKVTIPQSVGETTSTHRFQVLRHHAQGGLGEVSIALDKELGREVALKEIQSRHANHEESRTRFLLEAVVTGKLEHPGIVPVYGLGHHSDGRPFYTMRFVRGENLNDAIETFHKHDAQAKGWKDSTERSLEFRKLLRRFTDVCNAIEYAHSKGVLHRDLKPGNIMLGKYGETLVVDWGLAKVVGQSESESSESESLLHTSSVSGPASTEIGVALGTPAYMSPEQAEGRWDQLGPKSDVYGLGATMHCLLAGQRPFLDADQETILERVKTGDFKKPRDVCSSVPAPLEAVCLKAMSLNPDERYTTPSELTAEVEHWLADEPVGAYRDPFSVRARRWAKRHQKVVGGTVAAVLVALISLGIGNTVLNAKNMELSIANASETSARKLATDRFELAVDAIGQFHTGVSQEVILQQPELLPLANRQLHMALDFYRKLETNLVGSTDLASRKVLANTYMQIGELCRAVGENPQVREAIEKALAIRQELSEQSPDDPDTLRLLAESYTNYGTFLGRLHETDDAIMACQKSLRLLSQVAQHDPVSIYHQNSLITCHTNLGTLYDNKGRPNESREWHERAVALGREIIANPLHNDRSIRVVANAYRGYGTLLLLRGESNTGNDALKTSVDLLRKLEPTYAHQFELASSLNNLAQSYVNSGDLRAAQDAHREAANIREAIVEKYPTVDYFQHALAVSFRNYGLVHLGLGDRAIAVIYLSKSGAIANRLLLQNPGHVDARLLTVEFYTMVSTVLPDRTGAATSIQRAFHELSQIDSSTLDEVSLVGARILEAAAYGARGARSLEKHTTLKDLDRSDSILHDIVAEDPENQDAQFRFFSNFTTRARLYQRAKELESALEASRKAIDIGKKLLVAYPGLSAPRIDLARAYELLGDLQTSQAEVVAGHDTYQMGIAVLSSHIAKSPRDIRAFATRGDLHEKADDFDAAIKDRKQAINIAPEYLRPLYSLQLAKSMARGGDHVSAAHYAADAVSKGAKDGGDFFYEAACVFSLCAGAASADPDIEASLVNAYSGRAISHLLEIRKLPSRILTDPALAEQAQEDEDLDPIRSRSEFRALFPRPDRN